jgi:hypothetical protein
MEKLITVLSSVIYVMRASDPLTSCISRHTSVVTLTVTNIKYYLLRSEKMHCDVPYSFFFFSSGCMT